MAIVRGDPARPGPFTIRVAMPQGYRIPPHYHPVDEHVIVRSGTFLYGPGDRLERKAMRRLRRGETSAFPANMHHYMEASGPTEIEIASEGPFVTNYVNPADDPQKAAAKP
jgi:quercetin dioxygenase-like cupin family protein